MRMTALLLIALGCRAPVTPAPPGEPVEPATEAFARPAAHLTRLSDHAWVETVHQLTGVRYAGELPETERILGHISVGAATAGVSSLDEERLEAAAWAVATQMRAPACAFGESPAFDSANYGAITECARADLAQLAWQAWRRPLRGTELEALVDVWRGLRYDVGDGLALAAARAAVLSSPHFVYEIATGAPAEDGFRRLNGYEVATRVAFALTGRGPSEAWLLDAEAGRFDTAEGIRLHVEAALASDETTDALTAYWRELFDVDALATASKDPTLYPGFDGPLRDALSSEFNALIATQVLPPEADARDLFVTTWLPDDPLLQGLYGLGAGASDVELARGGVLGRGAFAATASHAGTTSPTLRGLFVLTRLLCRDIPPPPPGVVASLGSVEDVEGTLRDKLSQHLADPSCAACHASMDAAGFALEPLDPIGAWRTVDAGQPIDAHVRLDGVDIDGPGELGAWVGSHPDLARCLATDLWHHLTGSDDRAEDAVWIDAWASSWGSHWRWTSLLTDALTSDALRTVRADEGWQTAEVCNGLDDDGDGLTDGLRRGCSVDGVAGLAACDDGAWSACQVTALPAPTPATCPGPSTSTGAPAAAAVHPTTMEDILRVAPSCEPTYTPAGRGCEMAAVSLCAELGCGVGIGFVSGRDDVPWLACASEAHAQRVTPPWTALTSLDSTCVPGEVDRGGCHRAFDAWCRQQGHDGGWGPNADLGDNADGLCATDATRVGSTWSALRLTGGCDSWEGLQGGSCGESAHKTCQHAGFTTGWGPVPSADGTHDLDVVCFGDAP